MSLVLRLRSLREMVARSSTCPKVIPQLIGALRLLHQSLQKPLRSLSPRFRLTHPLPKPPQPMTPLAMSLSPVLLRAGTTQTQNARPLMQRVPLQSQYQLVRHYHRQNRSPSTLLTLLLSQQLVLNLSPPLRLPPQPSLSLPRSMVLMPPWRYSMTGL